MHRYTHRIKFEKKNCCFGSRLTRLANANASKANQIDAAVGDDVVGATPCEKVYYWCYCYERAVQRYAKTPNNGKNIELTLALCELQREFVQCYKDIDTLPPTEVEDEAHGVAQHMVCQYIYCLTVLVQYVAYERYCYIALGQEVVECS